MALVWAHRWRISSSQWYVGSLVQTGIAANIISFAVAKLDPYLNLGKWVAIIATISILTAERFENYEKTIHILTAQIKDIQAETVDFKAALLANNDTLMEMKKISEDMKKTTGTPNIEI